jgi:hypothetical protein
MAEGETDGNKDHVPHHPAQTSIDPKTNVASRNEREENVINVWGFETLLGKTGVHIMLHYERQTLHSMVPAGNLENKEAKGDTGRGSCLLCTEDVSESILEIHRNTEVERGGPEEQMATHQRGYKSG